MFIKARPVQTPAIREYRARPSFAYRITEDASVANLPISYEQYLDGLPPEPRVEVGRVWRVVREGVPDGDSAGRLTLL